MSAASHAPEGFGLARPDRRRDHLIERLIDLFLTDGFTELSVAEMAARLQCSKSTLYCIAASKEQIIVTVVRAYFRRATDRIEARLTGQTSVHDRIRQYLRAIAEELAPASPAFFADLDRFAPAREIYRNNTRIAAQRVQQIVEDAQHGTPAVDAAFVGVVTGLVMEAIHRGTIATESGLADAEAFRALADLIAAGVGGTQTAFERTA